MIQMIPIKTINQTTTTTFLQIFFPFFLLANCKSNIAASSITNAQLQHSKHQQFHIHKCKTTHYQVSLFKDLFSHYYHMFQFQVPKFLLSLLPITYYLLYCYLFPSFLFPVSCSRIPNSLTLE